MESPNSDSTDQFMIQGKARLCHKAHALREEGELLQGTMVW